MTPLRVHDEHEQGVTPGGIVERARLALRRFLCGLHGHDALLHYEQERLSLRCVSCGYETPGWNLAAREAERPVATRAQARPGIVTHRLSLAGARKI